MPDEPPSAPISPQDDAFLRVLAHRTMLKIHILRIIRDHHLAEDSAFAAPPPELRVIEGGLSRPLFLRPAWALAAAAAAVVRKREIATATHTLPRAAEI